MLIELIFAVVIIGSVLWLNTKATILIVHDSLSNLWQRAVQLFIVWLLPLAGAMVVLAIHRPIEKSSGTYSEPSEFGDDFSLLRHNPGSRFYESLDGD